MMRLVLAAIIAVAALAAAALIERHRRREPPTQPEWSSPAQLDRTDFPRPNAPWLVVVFSSATCNTCAAVAAAAGRLASDAVAVVDVEVGASPALHRRYRIDAVPITVVADRDGVVRADFVGPVDASALATAVARLQARPD